MQKFLVVMLCLACLLSASAAIAAPGSIDLSKGFSFERYLMTGKGVHMENIFKRLKEAELSDRLKAALDQIDRPVVFVVYGSITCPDCAIAVPILEKVREASPQVKTIYFERDNKAREFLLETTGRNRIPSIFMTDESGAVMGGHYVEFPRVVYELVEGSKNEDEKNDHIREFRSGKYDADVQSDLAEMIEGIL